ncbi:MAG: HNH endonuclease [Myxococcales bacterium]|nr:MAG: HNH endonuclease [Myxococcales bacterium]
MRAIDLMQAIENGSTPEPMSGCWLWIGALNPGGYGKLRNKGKSYIASRASWLAHHGPIPNGICVLHRCDTPSCVNPNHLFLGTNLDNSRDMSRKGRRKTPINRNIKFGADLPQTKLTDEDVVAIRDSSGPLAVTAKTYGISVSMVSLIRRGLARKRILRQRYETWLYGG